MVVLAAIPLGLGVLNGFYNPLLYRTSPILFWVVDIASFVVVPLLLAYWLATAANIRPQHYGLRLPMNWGHFLGSSLLLGMVLFCAYELARKVGWALAYRWYSSPGFAFGNVVPQGIAHLPTVLYMSVTAGVVESIFMLALPWYLWRDCFGLAHRRGTFVWLISLLFASIHWEQGPHSMVAAFAYGYLACRLYWRLNDLWPIVGAHTLIDIAEFF